MPRSTRLSRSRLARQPRPKPLTVEDFRYPEQLGLALPALVLAIPVQPWEFEKPELQRQYEFKPGRQWHRLAHQTAGMACHQHYMWATCLQPLNARIGQGMAAVAAKWEGSNVGVGGVTLREVRDYQLDLETLLGVDCNTCHREFEEAIYPIDVECLPKMALDVVPADLDELIAWRSGFERAIGCIHRFHVYLLSENSD